MSAIRLTVAMIFACAAIQASAAAFTEKNLHSFGATASDGQLPNAEVVQAADGNFYGTTNFGGASGYGTVYKITAAGTETVLYSFGASDTDGQRPQSGLILGSDGALYGTTPYGGAFGNGTVYKVTTAGVETIVHSFNASTGDGTTPLAPVMQASDGNFYGTTWAGGADGHGTVYMVTPEGVETVLHSFIHSETQGPGSDGLSPRGGLVQATDGNLYGGTEIGGAYGNGAVYKITTAGVESVLYSFGSVANDGANPETGLIQGADGNLYGTTSEGGAFADTTTGGTAFKMTLSGDETILHSFGAAGTDGTVPYYCMIQGKDGNFYGTTLDGGTGNSGIVYQLTPAGTETVLYTFGGSNSKDGAGGTSLIQAGDGKFYGVTAYGGANGYPTSYDTPDGFEGNGTFFVFAASGSGSSGGGSMGWDSLLLLSLCAIRRRARKLA